MKFDDIEHGFKRHQQADWDLLADTARGICVEVGTNHGASACALAQGADKVFTADIFDWQPKMWTGKPEAEKIFFVKGTSADMAAFLEQAVGVGECIDVLFIDGAHEYEYVTMDCKNLVPLVKSGGSIIFHDHNPQNHITNVHLAVDEFLKNVPHTNLGKAPGTNTLKIKKL